MAVKTETIHHPVFARFYQGLAAQAMEKGEAEFRRELLDGLAGRVIRRLRFWPSPSDRLASTQVLEAARRHEGARS